MKNILTMILLASVFYACQSKKVEEQSTQDSVTAMTIPVDNLNLLTDAQKTEGWVLLFDGVSMNGWRTFKNKENNSWEVSEGTLHCKPFDDKGENKRADLVTVDQYRDFELAFDWKISPQGNSGVMFRVTEEYDEPYATGPEYQILDDKGYPGEVAETNFTASNYAMHVAENKTVNPVGEWNSARIVVKGNHVEHWLNGQQVVSYELNSDDWKKRRAASKWKDFPGYGSAQKGHIDLQDHGNEVWFRKIMIKSL
jgi:hypothetical protein